MARHLAGVGGETRGSCTWRTRMDAEGSIWLRRVAAGQAARWRMNRSHYSKLTGHSTALAGVTGFSEGGEEETGSETDNDSPRGVLTEAEALVCKKWVAVQSLGVRGWGVDIVLLLGADYRFVF